jgi:peptide/nickel transport system substrate-binding protein
MARKLLIILIAVTAILGMVLPGCGGGTIEPEERDTGPFLDEVLITEEPNFTAAVTRLQTDDLDLFAYGLADAALFQTVVSDPRLTSTASIGSFNEFTFNPAGPVFNGTGKLNPFSSPKFREAMNWLIDRDYICDEIMGGLGDPRYLPMGTTSVDATVRFPSDAAALEAKYAFSKTKAEAAMKTAMETLGATKEGTGTAAKWMYNGEQVEIIGLIRTEDERKDMGDYFGNLLQDQGFKVTRQYGTSKVLGPIWQGNPNLGLMHYYTAGWVSTSIPLDESSNFGDFYTVLGWPGNPLWEAYHPDPAFYEKAEKLYNLEYASMGERNDLFKACLTMSMEDSVRIWLCDRKSFTPMQADVRVAADKAGGVYGSWMWALTAHFVDSAGDPIVGGTMRIGTGGILTEPWNPVAGTNWVYDMFPIRATGDLDTSPDTRTGLRWAHSLEKAEVFAVQGTPTEVENTEWCKLTFVPEIQVPLDAWADWDAVTQKFLTVRDRFGQSGTTAVRKTIAYYPKDIFETPLHDGSTLSVGDFIMRAIIHFDRGKPGSAIYDESYKASLESWLTVFKGVKYITDDPNYGLIVEFYSDLCPLNAELAASYASAQTLGWPEYAQGPGMWHTVTLGVMAEENKELAFSKSKSGKLGVEWTSFIAGPSIPILKSKLDSAKASSYIPYEPTMGDYVTEEEAAERWTSLSSWYEANKHFWVATGPFYLYKAFTTEKVIQLKRFEDYPHPMDRWLFLLEDL